MLLHGRIERITDEARLMEYRPQPLHSGQPLRVIDDSTRGLTSSAQRSGPGSMDIYHQLDSDLQGLVRFHLDNAQDFTYSFNHAYDDIKIHGHDFCSAGSDAMLHTMTHLLSEGVLKRTVLDCSYSFELRCRSGRIASLPWELDSAEVESITSKLPISKLMLRYDPPRHRQ